MADVGGELGAESREDATHHRWSTVLRGIAGVLLFTIAVIVVVFALGLERNSDSGDPANSGRVGSPISRVVDVPGSSFDGHTCYPFQLNC